ncbi:class I adenylate-forming enzyme family protein [Burkholderia anthina]|uniref:class I adenylate-forming enzyme family protein n=1 Tax=Burkholderia anthina TaxID=179879 RepID=UPI001ABBD569|nr:class I adenylate-forming enzyme family protein [Burkholderia anthina]
MMMINGDHDTIDIDLRLRKTALNSPDRVALADSYRSVTWGELDRRVNRIAWALLARGVALQDKIALLASNSAAYVELMLGILRAGACVVPLSTYTSASTWAAMVKDSGARLLFVSDDYASDALAHADDMKLSALDIVRLNDAALDEFVSRAADTPPPISMSPDHGFNLIYSSGTTGTPKGILQSRGFRAREAEVIQSRYALGGQTRTIVSTPLCSNTTLFLLFTVLACGGSVKVMEKFDAGGWLTLAETWRPTDVILVPVQYTRILAHPEFSRFDLSSLRNKFSTSAPLSAAIKRDILIRWPVGGLTEFYGMTEGGVTCELRAHERLDKLDTVGMPPAYVELRIIDDDKVLPQGQVGEIVGRSPTMMSGYYKREQATLDASWFDSEGRRFQRSGDVGWIDEDGFVHLLDRKKDVIISGGFNVYASDIENVISQHREVADVAVVAAPSISWGETPVACVVLCSDVEPEIIRQWANEKLGKVQRIAKVVVFDELPRNQIGKVLKRELRTWIMEKHGETLA